MTVWLQVPSLCLQIAGMLTDTVDRQNTISLVTDFIIEHFYNIEQLIKQT